MLQLVHVREAHLLPKCLVGDVLDSVHPVVVVYIVLVNRDAHGIDFEEFETVRSLSEVSQLEEVLLRLVDLFFQSDLLGHRDDRVLGQEELDWHFMDVVWLLEIQEDAMIIEYPLNFDEGFVVCHLEIDHFVEIGLVQSSETGFTNEAIDQVLRNGNQHLIIVLRLELQFPLFIS